MMLPEGWVETTIGDVIQPVEGAEPSASPSETFQYIDIGSIDNEAQMIREPKKILGSAAPSRARRRVRTGDVLFATVRPYLKNIAQVPPKLNGEVTSTGICVLRPASGIASGYLFRRVMSADFIAAMTLASDGTMYPAIADADVYSGLIAVPPAAEQRRIVAKLEVLTDRLARGRAEVDRVRFLAAKLRRAVLESVFKAQPYTPRTYLSSVCRVGTGSTPKRGESRFYANGNVPWVTSGSVNSGTVMTPTDLITSAALRETNCKLFPAGSILVALYGEGKTRGMVAVLGIAAATNQALAVLHDFEANVRPEWVRYFLQSRYEETRAEAAGGVQPNLNLGIIKGIELPLPSLSKQAEGICRIDAAFARADRLEAEATRARALLDRLEAAILAKAFRGELVPQDPNDEPASVLLDRIRAERAAAPKPKRGHARKAVG